MGMSNSVSYVTFTTVVSLLMFSTCSAWGPEGHELVAMIASRNVDVVTQTKLTELLGSNREIYDDEIANWADGYRVTHPDTGSFHFIDIPLDDTAIDLSQPWAQNCILQKLPAEIRVLGDATETQERRVEALKWVVHLMGDLHQPLHCSERDNDHGGNDVKVKYPGMAAKQKLHKVWDSLLLEEGLGDMELSDYAEKLNHDKPSDLTASIGDVELNTWALESHAIAKSSAYKDIPATNGVITTAYKNKNVPVVQLQLQLAGVRLAAILNLALGGESHPFLALNHQPAAALRIGPKPETLEAPASAAPQAAGALRRLRNPIELRD
jgi:S1/P1 Nuclease